ncbi:MAG: hypothetical protein IPN71_21670 [Fibrobacteres bacterium]|nr:hypothetical protein [Fibrobacterota bacterium]MBK8804619.1 hypothetical protein [Fibrobacterota bacterium]
MNSQNPKAASNGTNTVGILEHFRCRYAPFSDTFPLKDAWMSKVDGDNLRRMEALLSQGKSFALVESPEQASPCFSSDFWSDWTPRPIVRS